MSATITSIVTATGNATANRAPPQAGIFEGLNPAKYNANNPIILFIIQAAIVIALCRTLYWPLSKIRQPPVIAEVITGIVLGPSIMGRIPNFTNTIFPKESMAGFTLAANIGLIFYLFLVGLEIDIRFLVRNWRTAISVASLDMAIPFGLGYALAYGLYRQFRDEPNIVNINFATFGLFVAIAIAITAFPVLCRILSSLNLLNSNVGVVTLTSGIANDVIGWVLLALCVTLVNSGNGITALYVLLAATGYAVFLAYAVRPGFTWILRKTHSLENGPSQGVVALIILMVLISAFFTDIIGAHSVFGAFMIGLMCPHEGGFAIKLTEKLEDVVAALFLPLFFARSGLSTNLGLLDSGITWGYVVAIIVVAFVSKVIGGTIGARLNGLLWRESFTIGSLMSCKGLVELIVLNIGLQARILSTRTFTMFVVMALVTTFATTPLVSFLYPPSYQRKLELWKAGKIDWEGNPLSTDDSDEEQSRKKLDAADGLLVYLHADGLSSLFSLMNLFSNAGLRHSARQPTQLTPIPEKGLFTTALRHPTVVQAASSNDAVSHNRLRIHSLRLTELNERTSSVMRVSKPHEEYAGNDSITKAFGSLAYTPRSRNVVISGSVAVVPSDSFADTLASKAAQTSSDLIVLPWPETGTLSELPSYFVGGVQRDPLANKEFARLTVDVFRAARRTTGVIVYVDKTIIKTTSSPALASNPSSAVSTYDENAVTYSSVGSKTHLHALYASTSDDLLAVKIALQLAHSPSVNLHITRLPSAEQLDPETVHQNDTAFDDCCRYGASLTANKVVFSALDTAKLPESTFNENDQNTIFVVGRSMGRLPLVRVTTANAMESLGDRAADMIERFRHGTMRAGILVVQAREDSPAAVQSST
ncbi:K+ homeostasis protein kha1 [Stagonosporopsis vannaccii]|nr:K+ homeostasis protein kha1 [Stagonosporopsis vannaccii]